MRAAVAFSIAPLAIVLAGCRGDAAPEPPSSERPAATLGEQRASIAPHDGDAVLLRSGPKVPVSLPPGFTVYPGATVLSSTVVEREGARRVLLVFETPDPLAKVMAFHRGQAQAAGAVLTLDLGGPEQASIGGRLSSGGEFTISARQGAAGTRVEFSAN